MGRARKQYSPEFKLKAVVEILKEEKTATQLAGELGVHPVVLAEWKRHFMETGAQIFQKPKRTSKMNTEAREKSELFEQIGHLKIVRPPIFATQNWWPYNCFLGQYQQVFKIAFSSSNPMCEMIIPSLI